MKKYLFIPTCFCLVGICHEGPAIQNSQNGLTAIGLGKITLIADF